jgi:hypothetical protein
MCVASKFHAMRTVLLNGGQHDRPAHLEENVTKYLKHRSLAVGYQDKPG